MGNSEIRGNPVNFWSIDTELNKIYRISSVRNKTSCVEYDQIETLTSYEISGGWLWIGNSSNYNFTTAEQNSMVAQAELLAKNNAPVCSNGKKKSIISIIFFPTVTTDINNAYYIGCNVKYGCCKQLRPNDVD